MLGFIADSVEAQAKFKTKYKLNFPLLADTEFELIEAFGARRTKSFLGRWLGDRAEDVLGRAEQIDSEDVGNVPPKGHAAEVLAAIRGE